MVRAGVGAVWVAPMVTLATTAPASAAGSTTFAFTGLTAGYRNIDDPLTVLPQLVDVTATLVDDGPATTVTHVVTLTIPWWVSDEAPQTTPEQGFVVLPAVRSTDAETFDHWVLQFTRSATKLAGSSTVPFRTTITLGSTTAAPFLGYQGQEFTLLATASSNGGALQPAQAQVATTHFSDLDPGLGHYMAVHTPNPELDPSGHGRIDVWANSILVAGDLSRSSIGQLYLTLRLPRVADSPLWPAPTVADVDERWQLLGTMDAGSHWQMSFMTIVTGFVGVLGAEEDRGPGSFAATLNLGDQGTVPDFDLEWTFYADHLHEAHHTSVYPDVIAPPA